MTESTESGKVLSKAIAALEAQRAALGDAVTDSALAPLRAQLIEQQPLVPRRRQVTVLFLDIVGSTALSKTLDPEDIHDIMDTALQRFSALVVHRGGKVLQYAGDSLLAAFGAEAAREDDAERAVRAGLELLAEARLYAEHVQTVHGQSGFGVRVGAHTGHVLLGGGVDEEGTIRGFTVNIAARLEQAAPPGSLRISHDSWRHVRGVFEVEAQAPLQVKGQAEPLRTYLVLRAKPRAFRVPSRGIEGGETPLVGRDAELAQLVAAFDSTVQQRTLHAMTVLAEAGLGKSRLIQELQHKLKAHMQSCWLLLGRSQPSGSLQPFGLLRDVLAWRLQIADSDSAELARRRLVDGLAPLFAEEGELQAELLGQLIGLDFSASPRLQGVLNEPRLLRDRAFAAFASYVQGLAASDGSPVVMLLDDLQWADDASLDWVQHLLKSTDLPLTLVMAARPALLEHHPAWGEGLAHHARLTLSPLDERQRKTLTAALLSRLPGVPTALHSLLEAQAEGNPFYAEELVKMLIDEGVIAVDGEVWQLHADKLQCTQIPGTLTGVLQARLDALAGPERHALQMASIVGPVFWDAALSALDTAAPLALPALQQKAMVQSHADSAFDGSREEGFHHHLLHQVTYDTVLKADRRAGHARAAQWLAERVGDREAEYLAITAEHYDRAGDKARAIDWFWRAYRAASSRYAHSTALVYVQQLLAMIEPTDLLQRFKAYNSQKYLAAALGQVELQRQALDHASAIADRLDDDALRASVLGGRAMLADQAGDRTQAGALALRSAELAERSGAAAVAALARGELSWLASERGDVAGARYHVEIGLRWARKAAESMARPDDDMYEMQLLLVAANIHNVEHDWDSVDEALQRALKLAERSRHARIHASCHEFLAGLALEMCEVERAELHINRLESMARQTAVATMIASAIEHRGRLALLTGTLDLASLYSREAAFEYARIGRKALQARCLVLQAEALGRGEQFAAARDALQQALNIFESISANNDASASRLLIADTLRAEGETASAMDAVCAEILTLGQGDALSTSHSPLAARMAAWRVLAAVDDPRAALQLELAVAELERRTEKIRDPSRRSRVMEGIPLHREIRAAWTKLAV